MIRYLMITNSDTEGVTSCDITPYVCWILIERINDGVAQDQQK